MRNSLSSRTSIGTKSKLVNVYKIADLRGNFSYPLGKSASYMLSKERAKYNRKKYF